MARIIFEDGSFIELSEKEVAELKGWFKKKPFEALINGTLRVSYTGSHSVMKSWPIRLSLLSVMMEGAKMGSFPESYFSGDCPGWVVSVDTAKEIIKALEDCIAYVETLEGK